MAIFIAEMSFWLFIFLPFVASAGNQKKICYLENKKEAGPAVIPCNPDADISHCCYNTDYCLSNGLCLGAGTNNLLSVQGCTDQGWGAPCLSICQIAGMFLFIAPTEPRQPWLQIRSSGDLIEPTDDNTYGSSIIPCQDTIGTDGTTEYCCATIKDCCKNKMYITSVIPSQVKAIQPAGQLGSTTNPRVKELENQRIGYLVGLGISLFLVCGLLIVLWKKITQPWLRRRKHGTLLDGFDEGDAEDDDRKGFTLGRR